MKLYVSFDLRDQLDKEWYSDYASLHLTYPFFLWIQLKYRAQLVRNCSPHPFALIFNTQEDFDNFLEQFKPYVNHFGI